MYFSHLPEYPESFSELQRNTCRWDRSVSAGPCDARGFALEVLLDERGALSLRQECSLGIVAGGNQA